QRGYGRAGASDSGAFESNGSSPPALAPSRIVSRKTHASAGTFDVPLNSGAVESRSGSANGSHKLVFRFGNALASAGTVAVVGGSGTITSSGITDDPREYVVELTGVQDAQTTTVNLTAIKDSLGNSAGAV